MTYQQTFQMGPFRKEPVMDLGAVRLSPEWEDTLVHRGWTSASMAWREGIASLVCYGRMIGALDWSKTDEPITCIRCLGMSPQESGMSHSTEELRPLHRLPGYNLDPERRFKP